jgi:hypothetical protein
LEFLNFEKIVICRISGWPSKNNFNNEVDKDFLTTPPTLTNNMEKKMDNKQIARQMIQFNKTAVDTSFNALTMVYEQNEKMFETFLAQATGLPEEDKKAIQDWMSTYRTGCTDFKKQVDDNFAKVEEYFDKE